MSISKVNVSGTDHQIVGSPRYATCSTAAATAAKVATIADGSSTFSLEKGARICVSFTYANTASAATLNVASTGAKAICWNGSALVSSQYWQAGAVVDFVYDGNGWSIVGVAKDNNSTNFLPLSGGSLTGNLTVGSSSIGTNGYIEGTRLKTTESTEKAGDFATISGDGWIYKRAPANVLGDIGGQAKITANGILKGDGTGGVSAAVKGTDYFTPADVNEIAAEAAKKVDISDKVSKSGDTMTGKLTVPQVETGDGNSNFFQCRKFRGEGNADTYYHAIDFGYQNHDRVDFHEYGGLWSFYKNQTGKVNDGVLCGKITSNGWEGRAKLESGSTMVTSQLTENSNAIATTAFVHGLVDGLKSKGVSVTLPASGWNANAKTQTVNVSGVTATVNLIITASPDSYMAYAKAGVRCTAQGAGTLTFACETVPTADVAANVLILG